MSTLRHLVSSFSIILVCILAFQISGYCQSTRVKGRVYDRSTGEPVPFAGIYFKGTFIGVSTDLEGNFTLETNENVDNTLTASILGYETLEKSIKPGAYNQIDFALTPIYSELKGSTIKADDRKVRRLLSNVHQNRYRNDPENFPAYECDTYSKMQIDIIEAEKQFSGSTFRKEFGFIFDYIDTSVVNGRTFLPALLTETLARKYHQKSPSLDKEVITANRISGIENTPSLAQFTGSLHVKTNIYQNFIDVFDVQIPSPISPSGNMYYKYFLIDSLDVAGRKTYKVRFHPNDYVSTPVFDGEINIDAEDYAVQEAHIKLVRGPAVNFIHEMVIDIENQKCDSVWFYRKDKFFAEFSPQKDDSYELLSFFGTRQIDYSNPVISDRIDNRPEIRGSNVLIKKDAVHNDEAFWQNARPYPLSEKEQGIYKMVSDVQAAPAYKGLYMLFSAATNGFFDIGKIGLGPYYKAISFNNLEGTRLLFGGRTTLQYSRNRRYTGYIAYGTRDRQFKGGLTAEYMFGNDPTRKLTLNARHDMLQLGRSDDAFVEGNIMSSIMSKGDSEKLSPVSEYSVVYEHEFTPGFTSTFATEIKRIWSNNYVPMVTPSGENISSVAMNQLRYTGRFSWDEIVARGPFEKYHMYSEYPVITVNLLGSFKGLGQNSYAYFRPEIVLSYRLQMPPIGVSTIQLNAGKIFGQVPYPLLKLHEGNGSYFLDPGAFACMDYYEFASDQWVTMQYFHEFKGAILGKIPLIRRLGWRENFIAKAAWGSLSDKNDGSLGSESKAPLLFPEGMSSLSTPYVEIGGGISNIFQIFRVDFYRRMTHLREDKKNYAINFGIEFSF